MKVSGDFGCRLEVSNEVFINFHLLLYCNV